MKARRQQIGTWEYTPLGDRELPPDEQSRFTFSPLAFEERCALVDQSSIYVNTVTGEKEVRPRTFRSALELVRLHLVKAENFPAGEPKAWPADGSAAEKDAYLSLLGEAVVYEFGEEIWERSRMGEPEKNSSTA